MVDYFATLLIFCADEEEPESRLTETRSVLSQYAKAVDPKTPEEEKALTIYLQGLMIILAANPGLIRPCLLAAKWEADPEWLNLFKSVFMYGTGATSLPADIHTRMADIARQLSAAADMPADWSDYVESNILCASVCLWSYAGVDRPAALKAAEQTIKAMLKGKIQ